MLVWSGARALQTRTELLDSYLPSIANALHLTLNLSGEYRGRGGGGGT